MSYQKVKQNFFSVGGGQLQCKLCDQQFKKQYLGNMKRHLLRKHADLCNDIKLKKVAKSIDSTTTRNCSDRSLFLKSIVELTALHDLPVRFLELECFRNLVRPVCAQMGVKVDKDLTGVIQNIANQIRQNIRAVIMDVGKFVSIKLDLVSDKYRSILGIHCTHIADCDEKLGIYTLGIIKLNLNNNNNVIVNDLSDEIIKVLEDFGITYSKIYAITLDQNFQGSFPISAEAQNDKNIPERIGIIDTPYSSFKSNNLLETLLKEELKSRLPPDIPIIRCAVHTLELVAMDVLAQYSGILTAIYEKIKDLASIKFQQLREGSGINILQPSCIQGNIMSYSWKFTCKLLAHLEKHSEELKNMTKSIPNFAFTSDEWMLIESISQAFEPLVEMATACFENSTKSIGDYYLGMIGIIKDLTENTSEPAQAVFAAVTARIKDLFIEDTYCAAAFLDPRINFERSILLSEDLKWDAKAHLLQTWERIRKKDKTATCPTKLDNNIPEPNASINMSIRGNTSVIKPLSSIDDYIDAICQGGIPLKAEKGDGVLEMETKLARLARSAKLPSKTDIHKYWYDKKLEEPELYELSNIILSASPTQLSIERTLAALKYWTDSSGNNSNLDAEGLDSTCSGVDSDILMIKLNRDLMEQASFA